MPDERLQHSRLKPALVCAVGVAFFYVALTPALALSQDRIDFERLEEEEIDFDRLPSADSLQIDDAPLLDESEQPVQEDAATADIDAVLGQSGDVEQAGATGTTTVERKPRQASPLDAIMHRLNRRQVEGTLSPNYVSIPINDMEDFNFQTKETILSIRRQEVDKHFHLIRRSYTPPGGRTGSARNYSPSPEVFGSIVGGKAWWGMKGMSFHGPGKKSIEGFSEESRFVLNPFLFVGIAAPYARVVNTDILEPQAVYPVLRNLQFNPVNMIGVAFYDMTKYYEMARVYRYSPMSQSTFTLVAYNARDFGFNYLDIEQKRTRKIAHSRKGKKAMEILQGLRLGYSCKYQGGCNNMMPSQPQLEVRLTDLPAILFIKLWREEPDNVRDKADMAFKIVMQ